VPPEAVTLPRIPPPALIDAVEVIPDPFVHPTMEEFEHIEQPVDEI
jgi:hypothetical protein